MQERHVVAPAAGRERVERRARRRPHQLHHASPPARDHEPAAEAHPAHAHVAEARVREHAAEPRPGG